MEQIRYEYGSTDTDVMRYGGLNKQTILFFSLCFANLIKDNRESTKNIQHILSKTINLRCN